MKSIVTLVALFLITSTSVQSQEKPKVDDLVAPIKAQVSSPTEPFSLQINFTIIPDKENEFEKEFAQAIRETRKEKGNGAFLLSRHPREKNVYFLYERWANLSAVEKHMGTKHMMNFWPKFFKMIAHVPRIETFMVHDLQKND